jgi:cellulose 1,4-beta-cellobiosidase
MKRLRRNRGILYVTVLSVVLILNAGCSKDSKTPPPTTTTMTTPAAPLNVSAGDGTDLSNVIISWSSVSGADHYMVYRSETQDGEYTLISGEIKADTSYSDSVAPFVHYFYKVRAFTGVRGNRKA